MAVTYIVCAVFDRGTQAYGSPFFMKAAGEAVRMFSDAVNTESQDSLMFKHPSDFELFALGQFDDASGMFDTHSPKLLARGEDVSTRRKLQ